MWNGPVSKVLLRNSPLDGAVICPAYQCGPRPLATMRSAVPIALSILRARRRSESDGLIGIEVSSLWFITLWHLAVHPSAETLKLPLSYTFTMAAGGW